MYEHWLGGKFAEPWGLCLETDFPNACPLVELSNKRDLYLHLFRSYLSSVFGVEPVKDAQKAAHSQD
jgi:hypothetical protein